ncbi:hypothetical protein P7C71_g592, partial [Lecanoromycetidae sp. Uapishka_2]
MEEPSTLTTYFSKPNSSNNGFRSSSSIKKNGILAYEPSRTAIETHEDYEYEDLRPMFPDVRWDPLTEVPYYDKGIRGDSQFRNLLADATDIFDYNPKIGTEVHGINLAKLTNAQKDDLARLIAIRGVVFFRNQTDLDIDAQRELTGYFGKLHKHATTSVPRRGDLDDVHVVYTDEKSKEQRANFAPTFLWHSDNHSASYGFAPHRRHAVRTACQAERPVFDSAGKSQEEELNARYGLPKVNKDGSGQGNYND